MKEIKIGDVVKLKHHNQHSSVKSKIMTVVGKTSSNEVKCMYYNHLTGLFVEVRVHKDALHICTS